MSLLSWARGAVQGRRNNTESTTPAQSDHQGALRIALYSCAIVVPLTLGIAVAAPKEITDKFGVLLTAIATAVVAAFTYSLWDATRAMRDGADDALTHAQDVSQIELRAYLSVAAGSGFYQDRSKGFYFGGNPQLINSGKTPAYNISYWANADILDRPLPPSATLSPPEKTVTHNAVCGGNGDGFSIGAHIGRFVDDAEVEAIKRLTGDKALYVWGRVDYQDAFGAPHWTEFCQLTYFNIGDDGKEKVNVTYVEGRNRADQHGPLKKRSSNKS